jgi:hypothetical protein
MFFDETHLLFVRHVAVLIQMWRTDSHTVHDEVVDVPSDALV